MNMYIKLSFCSQCRQEFCDHPRNMLCFWPGGTRRGIKQGTRSMGFPGSFSTRRGACFDQGGARKDEWRRSRGRVEFEWGTKLIFRLRYKIDNYTCYIGNRAPSPKRETDQHYRLERAGEKGIHVQLRYESRDTRFDSGMRTAAQVLTSPTLRVTMSNATYPILHWRAVRNVVDF
jgi:hypothetical protein